MFNFNLNNYLTVKGVSYYDKNNELKFEPPVYEQRYGSVVKILEHQYWRGNLKKVIDFGCAEMKLATLLKRIDGIEHILEIDIDDELLKMNLQRVKPLTSDYIAHRENPLRIDVYKGSVDSSVNCIKNTDAVIAIELIEHLEPDCFQKFPSNIFGFIKPKLVIISTPNSDFNVLFEMNLPNGFRHLDHKFEWSREQFKDWCNNICQRYQNYIFSIAGIGRGPPDKRQYGCVSQMAVFIRKDLLGGTLIEDTPDIEALSVVDKQKNDYELLLSVEFPYTTDNRDNNQKILDEAIYHITRYTLTDRYWNIEKNIYEIPILKVFEFVFPLAISVDELKNVLGDNKYNIENDLILIQSENNDTDDDDDNDDGDDDKDEDHKSDQNKHNIDSNYDEIWD